MISFKASLINYTTINRINPRNEQYITSFVELDTRNQEDFLALQSIAKKWENGFSLAQDVYNDFKCDRNGTHLFESVKKRFFALINEKKPVKMLDPDSILGIASVSNEQDEAFVLEFLQTNPEHKYGNENRKFKHIGKALLNSIIDILPNKDLKLYPVDKDAELFYRKNIFVKKQKAGFLKFRI